ncbi:Conserved_hypothetical protein [Hexamita inflata]|uniref:Raptor N-terminal CASPase-like domain-containing protein n=1 Tax=Hexamita inflata TaxID=28002 RepID=A0ABP1J017_9EUKA
MQVLDLNQSEVNQQPEIPSFSYMRHDLPFSHYQNYAHNLQSPPIQQSPLQNVLILTALEFTEELRQIQWVESKTDLIQLPVDQIKLKIVSGLEYQYKKVDLGYQNVRGIFQPTLNEVKKHLSQQSNKGRYLVHYVGRHARLQLEDAIVMSQDEASRAPLAVSITEIAKILQKNDQSVFILDCNYAGQLVECLRDLCRSEYDLLAFGACSSNQKLPYLQQSNMRLAPTDLFSFCMLNPLQAMFTGYVYKHLRLKDSEFQTFQQILVKYEELFEANGTAKQLSTELGSILKLICDTIAWVSVPKDKFSQLCKSDKGTSNLVRNYFVAQRVMSIFNCDVCCTLDLPNQCHNPLWSSFDMCINQALQPKLSQAKQDSREPSASCSPVEPLSSINSVSMANLQALYTTNYTPSNMQMRQSKRENVFNFNEEQIQSFELQLSFMQSDSKCPNNLPIIIGLTENFNYRIKCLQLLSKFCDLCPVYIFDMAQIGLVVTICKMIRGLIEQKVDKNIEAQVLKYCIFLLNKIFASNILLTKYFQIYRASGQITDKDYLYKLVHQYIKQPKTSVTDRLIYIQFLTLMSSQLLVDSFYPEFCKKEIQSFAYSCGNYLVNNNFINLAKAFSQSSDASTRAWSAHLVGNMIPFIISNEPIGSIQDFGKQMTHKMRQSSQIQTVEEVQQKNLLTLNKQTLFLKLGDIALFYTSQLRDDIPEVRSAAMFVIQQVMPKPMVLPAMQEQSNILTNWLELSVYDAILKAAQDPCPFVRYEVLQFVSKHIICYFRTFVVQVLKQIRSKFIDKLFKHIDGDNENERSKICLRVLEILAYDAVSSISTQAGFIIQNLNNYALLQLAKDIKLESKFYSSFQENLKDNLSPEDKKQFELRKTLFSDWELKIIKEHKGDLKQLYETLKDETKPNSEIVKLSYDDYSSLKAVLNDTDGGVKCSDLKLANMQPEESLESTASAKNLEGLNMLELPLMTEQLVIDFPVMGMQNSSNKSNEAKDINFNSNWPAISDIPKMSTDMNNDLMAGFGANNMVNQFVFDGINDPEDNGDDEHCLPVFNNYDIPQIEGIPQIQEAKQLDLEFATEFDRKKFEFIAQRLDTLSEFDTLLNATALVVYFNPMFVAVQEQKTPLFNLLVHGLKQQSIWSNLIQLGQSMTTQLHRQIQGCFNHNNISCKDCGTMSNRTFNMKCQSCGQPSQYGLYLIYSEQGVKSFSSCYSLSQNQRLDFSKISQEFKKIDTQNSLFLTTLTKSLKNNEPKSQSKLQQYIVQLQQHKSDPKLVQKPFIIRPSSNQTIIDISQNGKQQILKTYNQRPLPDTCESFIFALPICDFSEVLQDEIALHLNTTLPDNVMKVKLQNQTKFQVLKWYESLYIMKNAQTTNNQNILVDGVIYQQYQLPYDSLQVQQTLQSAIKLLQVFDQSLLNVDVANLSEQIESLNALVIIDQSCPLCRNIAVRKSLLQKCAQANRTITQSVQQNFVYHPTRDFAHLSVPEMKKKQKIVVGLDAEKNQLTPQQFQTFMKRYVDQIASPFPYLDPQAFCTSQSSFKHCQMGRSIYRLVYNLSDPLLTMININPHQIQTTKAQMATCGSVVNMIQQDSTEEKMQESIQVQNYLIQVTGGNPQTQPTQIQMKAYAMSPRGNNNNNTSNNNVQKSQSVQFFMQDSYEQAEQHTFRPPNNVNDYFREQIKYIQGKNQVQRNLKAVDQFQLQQQFYLPNAVKKLSMHPTLPVIAGYTNENGICLFNLEKRCNMNVIDQEMLQDLSAQTLREDILCHKHLEMNNYTSNIKTMSQFMRETANSMSNMYYAYLQDRELESQNCCICQSIKEANNFSQYTRNYDLYDTQCRKALDSTQKYAGEHQAELSEFFENDAVPAQAYPKYLRNFKQQQADLTQMQFMNTKTTHQLLGASFEDSVFKIYQNPFDVGLCRFTSGFKVFERSEVQLVDLLGILPGFDLVRRIAYHRQQNNLDYVQNDLFKMYIENKLGTILNEMTQIEEFQPPLERFLTHIGQNGLFARGQEVKLFDLHRERAMIEWSHNDIDKNGINTISAVHQNGNVIGLGDIDGQIQLFDVRSKTRVNLFKFDKQIDSLNIDNADTVSAYLKSHSFTKQQGHKQILEIKITETGNGVVNSNMGCLSQPKGQVAIFDLNGSKSSAMKLDRFQGISWRDDLRGFSVFQDQQIRVYGEK